jgi:quercetin dioxygenase-like cupin family protein
MKTKTEWNSTKIVKRATALVRGRLFVWAAVVAMISATSVAFAFTAGSGVILRNDFVRAGFVDPTDLKLKVTGQQGQEVIHVPNAQETVFQQVVIAPGGYTGWHSHPGPVLVLIKSGQLSFYDGEDPTCTPRVYTAGQAFIDRGQGHVHIGRNEGSENLEMWSAYFDVPPGQPFRIDVPAPGNCGF